MRWRRRLTRGHRRWLILAVSVVGLALVVVAAIARYYPAYRNALEARDQLQEAQALLDDRGLDASEADLDQADALLDEAERDFADARGTLDDPLVRAGAHLPLVGASFEATTGLLELGEEGAGMGHDAVAVGQTYRQSRDEREGALTEGVDELLEEIEPSMSAIRERLHRMKARRNELTGAPLPPPFASAVAEMDDDLARLDELVTTYENLSAFVPEFLGFHGRRTYLLLAQNNAELMPTGGLISVYGVVTIDDGRIVDKRFEDAVSYGGRWLDRTDAYVEPPEPLRRHLLREMSWNLAVSNWSPDYPTAAREAERFYRLAGGEPVDGVIAFNVRTIEELLRVTGPITVEGITVSANNAIDVIEEHTRSADDATTDRKAFVGVLADELLSRLTHASSEQWTPLVEAMARLRDERQVLIFSHDARTQESAARLGLDGALDGGEGDYFMLVDASVNSTKLNIALSERIDMAVQIDEDGTASHNATVWYRNDLPVWQQGRDPELVRRLMLGGLYGGYVRMLAPLGSRLESIALDGREAGPEEAGVEQEKAVFGRFFALASGEETELRFRYETPGVVKERDGYLEYRMHIQKQSGTGAIPFRLRLTLPRGATLRNAELDGEPIESLGAIETDLQEDRELVVQYELER
ncbi:MAG: DUF4012 domain-containing protein [Dehalococcoidia bacterium]